MGGAFVYLSACSARNRVRVRMRRLRQPRYLIGSLAGLLYLYTFVFRHALARPGRPGVSPLAALDRASDAIEIAGAAALFVVAAVAWAMPGVGKAIEFSRSEVQFLFQAPLTRRQLLHYKLLRGQAGALFGTAIATVFLRPGSFGAGWTFLVGIWLLLAATRLHLTGVALRRQSLAQHGANAVRRQWLPLLVVSAATVTLVAVVAADWPRLSVLENGQEVFRELGRLATTGPAPWILWPFRSLVHLPLSGSVEAFGRALPPVLILLALNYAWVLRGDVAFEEASAAYAERRSLERGRPPGAGRNVKLVPFPLSVGGRPEIAILWKNLILLGRYASVRVLVRFVPLVLILAAVLSRRSSSGIASSIVGIGVLGAGLTVLLGPQTMRNDFRQDLASLGTLKSWPVRGAALVRGELLAPAVVLTCVTWLLIAVAAMFVHAHGGARFARPPIPIAQAVPLAIAAALLAPALILSQLVVQNGLAIVFPAWVTVGAARARGIDAMGQRLLMMAGVVLVIVLALVPGAALAGAAAYVLVSLAPKAHAVLLIVPSFVVTATVLAECWVAIELLGRVFDRTDVGSLDGIE